MTTNEPAPPAPPVDAAPASTSLSPARIVAGLGAVVTIVSIFLNWADVSAPGGNVTRSGTGVPLDFLWDKTTHSTDPSLLLPLVIAAVLIGLGVLLPTARLAGFLGGVLAIAVAVLYCVQVQRGLDDGLAPGISLTDFISVGVYVAGVGGILGIVGAAIPDKT